MLLKFIPISVFRETPHVSFFDAGVKELNGADVVIHHRNAMSPTNDENFEQYFIHYQIDHNLVIKSRRTFNLINTKWGKPNHIIF